MKRLIVAGFLLIFVIGIIIGGRLITEHYSDSFISRIEECEALYESGDKKTAAIKAAEIEDDFSAAHHRLVAFINRNTIDEIVSSITRIKSYAAGEDDLLFESECEIAKMLLRHMLESESLSPLSIL